jgi:hypothetical protein
VIATRPTASPARVATATPKPPNGPARKAIAPTSYSRSRLWRLTLERRFSSSVLRPFWPTETRSTSSSSPTASGGPKREFPRTPAEKPHSRPSQPTKGRHEARWGPLSSSAPPPKRANSPPHLQTNGRQGDSHFMPIRSCVSSLLLLLAIPLAAQRSPRLLDPMVAGPSLLPAPQPDAVQTIRLEATRESWIRFPAFELDFLADGTRAIRGVLITQEPSVQQHIGFEIDPIAGTYRTYRLPDLPPRERPPSRPIRCTCEDPCTGNWSAVLTTLDPLFIALTRTAGDIEWTSVTSGCKIQSQGLGACWAANPSPLVGTHWYVSGCLWNSPSSQVNLSVAGQFYNWDFLDDNKSTWVTQFLNVRLSHSLGVIATFDHHDSGEAHQLIYGSAWQSGYWSPQCTY